MRTKTLKKYNTKKTRKNRKSGNKHLVKKRTTMNKYKSNKISMLGGMEYDPYDREGVDYKDLEQTGKSFFNSQYKKRRFENETMPMEKQKLTSYLYQNRPAHMRHLKPNDKKFKTFPITNDDEEVANTLLGMKNQLNNDKEAADTLISIPKNV